MPYNIIENFNLLLPIIFLDGTFIKETIVKGKYLNKKSIKNLLKNLLKIY